MADTITAKGLTKPEVGASVDSWGGKHNANFDKIDALLGGYTTAGGTANAITLTTGASLTAIPVGFAFRFKPTAANTGVTTIAVDGLTAVAAKTVTGVDTPAGYMRAGLVTVAVYDGTNFIVSRETETGTNANGRWTRYADGTQECERTDFSITDAATVTGSLYKSSPEATWTLPKAFSTDDGLVTSANPRNAGDIWAKSRTTSATTAAIRLFATTSVSGAIVVECSARGRWY